MRGRSRMNSSRQIDLGDPQRPALVFGVVLEPLGDFVDVGALLVGEVALDQLEHLVERDQRADGLLGECRAIGDEHLVGLLDDRPVAAAVVPGRTGLEPDARHDADAEVDVVRRVRVEVDEIALVDVGAAGRAFQPQGGVQLPLVVGEELLQDGGSASVFFASTRFVATSRMSEGARSTR